MSRPLLLAALASVALAGCTGTKNLGVESIKQPVVERQSYSLDVQTDGAGLAPGEDARLAGWMGSLRLGYGDQVAVDDPVHDGAVRDAVARQAARFGLLVADDLPVSGAPVASGTARVVISRLSASVPHCPDWSRNGAHEFESSTSSNYGCAVNSNLAAMVANPADLVRGEPGSGTADPLTAGKAISAYRSAANQGGGGTTVKSESTGGK